MRQSRRVNVALVCSSSRLLGRPAAVNLLCIDGADAILPAQLAARKIVPRAQQSVRRSRKVDNLTLNSSLRWTEGAAMISSLAIIRKRPKRPLPHGDPIV